MGQRVTLETAARLTGRAEKTLRAWLAEDPCPLDVAYGHYRGGVRLRGQKEVKRGRTRLLDVDALQQLNTERGGTWHPEHLPPPDISELGAEMQALRQRVAALEARLGLAGMTGTGRVSVSPASPRVSPYVPAMPPASIPSVATVPVPVLPSQAATPWAGERFVAGAGARPQPLHRLSPSQAALHAHLLPAGWMPVSTFCRLHGLNDRSVIRQSVEGRIHMPTPQTSKDHPWGNWRPGEHRYYDVTTAYSAEQLPEACRLAASIWPRRWHLCDNPECPCHTVGRSLHEA